MANRILVVDDEPQILSVLKAYLEADGFEVITAATGADALNLAARLGAELDLVLLDIGLPDLNGLDVLARIRADIDPYVILVTARADEVDKLIGLSVGADDYITKPFSPREVVARVKAVVRRARGPQAQSQTVRLGKVEMDPMTRRCTVDGRVVDLTATEFDLLFYLMTHPGQIFSRDQLLSEVWGYAAMVNTRTVDVHVAQLRGKLGENNIIRTVRGVGYGAEVSESDPDAQ